MPEFFRNKYLNFIRQYPPSLLCLANWILAIKCWIWTRKKTSIIGRCNLSVIISTELKARRLLTRVANWGRSKECGPSPIVPMQWFCPIIGISIAA